MSKLLAQVGNITNPFNVIAPASSPLRNTDTGLVSLLTSVIRAAIVVAGIYAMINFILAGYGFLQAGGEPKAIAKSWEKIWQSLLGLILVSGAIVLAAVVGWLVFGDATIIINPRVYSPV